MKAPIDYGSAGNYIGDSLVPALGMEVVPEKDFEVLELANANYYQGTRLRILLVG